MFLFSAGARWILTMALLPPCVQKYGLYHHTDLETFRSVLSGGCIVVLCQAK